jgi:hypothetical protein
MRTATRLALALIAVLVAGGCAGRTEVVVIGTVHDQHRKNPHYSTALLRRMLARLEPDLLLVEIPPDRWPLALEEHRRTGQVTEPRVRVFPEYVDVLLPMLARKELKAEVVPAAGWTRAMNDARKAKLAEYPKTRPAQWAESEAAEKRAEQRLKAEGLADEPRGIHSDRYDAIVKEGLAPYSRHFNDDLGPGGWENINAAHWALIAAALDRVRGKGKRVVITFGAWHKYWFREQLARRPDVKERGLYDALEEADEDFNEGGREKRRDSSRQRR